MSKALETMLSRMDEPARTRFLELWDESSAFWREGARLRKLAFQVYREHRIDKTQEGGATKATTDTTGGR